MGIIAGSAILVAIDWVFAPWSFYMGGSFHALPVWHGEARMHASSGDYTVYLWIQPWNGGKRMSNSPLFTGTAWLCTPRGERYRLRLTASMSEHPGTDTNGKEMRIEMYQRRWFWSLTGNHRPELTFRGHWQNPDFVATDGGTLSRAFLPDGRLYDGGGSSQPRSRETVPVVFHEVPWTAWFSDCRAVK